MAEAGARMFKMATNHICSPRRLDLQLTCTRRTPVREMLAAFPNFPININYRNNTPSLHDSCEYLDNILAALERRDHVRRISLSALTSSRLGTFVVAMQAPFPSLTFLELMSNDGMDSSLVIPDTFLGRSAPSLQFLCLSGIAFPGLPKLLFSTRNLVSLIFMPVPMTGYIPPESLADSLSVLPRLRHFDIIPRYPLLPHLYYFPGHQRIPEGPGGPNQCSTTQFCRDILLRPTRF
ncbi:hypothetical protein BJV74DRAFT_102233 [Russula compacta]|nr:hypothetical protein BJV74DRAFT_102233 [Russula compacta]